MVWGRPGPAVESNRVTVSRLRVVVGLASVAAAGAVLVDLVGLGPSWAVVATAALGAGATFVVARASARVALTAVIVIGVGGMAWVESVNEARFGTLSLTGTPPLVRWCGTTYRPDGMAATAPGRSGPAASTEILRTPSGHDVYAPSSPGPRPCTAGGALYIEAGPGHWLVYGPAH